MTLKEQVHIHSFVLVQLSDKNQIQLHANETLRRLIYLRVVCETIFKVT